MSEPLGVIHLRAVMEPEIPVCRGEMGPADRLGEEREGDCPQCLAIRSGKHVKIYVGRRREDRGDPMTETTTLHPTAREDAK